MIKLMKECLTGRYRKFAVLGPICVILEVFFDIFIPLVMAKIIDVGINDIENGGLGYIINMGLFMILLAGLSMLCGALSSKCSGIEMCIRDRSRASGENYIYRCCWSASAAHYKILL